MKGMNEKAGPKISIVIANYNYGRYLRQCIDSCLSQTYPPHEIIVVDDGSTDDSRIILKEYESHPLVKLILQDNQGQEAALQGGFDLCSGDWVLGLDSDDFYFPDCLETVADVVDRDYVLVYFKAQTVDADGRKHGSTVPSGTLLCDDKIKELWITKGHHHSFPPQSFNCYACEWLRSHRIHPHEVICMKNGFSCDRYMQLQAVISGKVKGLNRVLGAYRLHNLGDNTQKRINLQALRMAVLSHDLAVAHLKKKADLPTKSLHPSFQLDHFYWFHRMLSLVTDTSRHTHPKDTRWTLLQANLASESKCIGQHNLAEKIINYIKLLLLFVLPEGLFFQIYLFRPIYRTKKWFKKCSVNNRKISV